MSAVLDFFLHNFFCIQNFPFFFSINFLHCELSPAQLKMVDYMNELRALHHFGFVVQRDRTAINSEQAEVSCTINLGSDGNH